MKTFLAFWLFFATQWTYCQPAPSNVNLPVTLTAADHARLNALVNDILSKDAELKANLADIRDEERKAEVNLTMVQVKLDKDESTIATLKARMAVLQTFARVVLGFIFVLGAALAFKLTQGLSLAPPWGWIARLALCLAAGALASTLVWRIITHLL
jgi:hypothetical protein